MFKAEHSDEVFPEYQPIIESIIEANFAKYDEHFEKYQRLWIKRGIYLLMDKLRVLIWRNLLKKISQVQDK
jgi:predicted ATP-dependent Lon-type protease